VPHRDRMPGGRQQVPFSSKIPARAPMFRHRCRRRRAALQTPCQDQRSSPAVYLPSRGQRPPSSRLAARRTPGTGRRMQSRRPLHSRHRRTADQGILHPRGFDECVDGALRYKRATALTRTPRCAPLAGERLGQMGPRFLRGLSVETAPAACLDDEAGHRTNVHNEPTSRLSM